ncbi:MAG: hypothetical protein NZ761_08450 [Dehalococcoidia bacterium]|nr:hypothetical protein [Dehalococcoidia bacterium]
MTEQDFDEEFLRERLQETASGEAALRQLRRRYDLLRQEYDRLLDRLERLEQRLGRAADTSAPPERLRDAVAHPLLRLREEYAQAAKTIDAILRGLERLADELEAPQPTPAPARRPQPEAEPVRVQLEVRGGEFGRILDFQERLAGIEGVRRVSISAIDHERATLIVELEP